MTFVNLRTDLRGHIRGIAHLHLLKGFGKCRDELVINPFLHEDAGTRAADLALVKENADLSAFNRLIKLSVIKDDVGGLAAQFKRSGNEALGGGFRNRIAHFRGTGEGKLVKARVIKHCLTAHGTAARDNVDDTGRQHLGKELAELV